MNLSEILIIKSLCKYLKWLSTSVKSKNSIKILANLNGSSGVLKNRNLSKSHRYKYERPNPGTASLKRGPEPMDFHGFRDLVVDPQLSPHEQMEERTDRNSANRASYSCPGMKWAHPRRGAGRTLTAGGQSVPAVLRAQSRAHQLFVPKPFSPHLPLSPSPGPRWPWSSGHHLLGLMCWVFMFQ